MLSVVCVSQEIDSFLAETGNALQSGMLRFVGEPKTVAGNRKFKVFGNL